MFYLLIFFLLHKISHLLTAFKIFLLPILRNVILICFAKVFFMFVGLEFHWISYICEFIFFIIFGHFWQFFFKMFFCNSFPLVTQNIQILASWSYLITYLCSVNFFFNSLFLLCFTLDCLYFYVFEFTKFIKLFFFNVSSTCNMFQCVFHFIIYNFIFRN